VHCIAKLVLKLQVWLEDLKDLVMFQGTPGAPGPTGPTGRAGKRVKTSHVTDKMYRINELY